MSADVVQYYGFAVGGSRHRTWLTMSNRMRMNFSFPFSTESMKTWKMTSTNLEAKVVMIFLGPFTLKFTDAFALGEAILICCCIINPSLGGAD